jgi:hypothetical protein
MFFSIETNVIKEGQHDKGQRMEQIQTNFFFFFFFGGGGEIWPILRMFAPESEFINTRKDISSRKDTFLLTGQ